MPFADFRLLDPSDARLCDGLPPLCPGPAMTVGGNPARAAA
jgi:hypothetical protein